MADAARRSADESPPGSPGVAVDARGGAVIDPTKNVLDLVFAEARYQNGMRDGQEKLHAFAMQAQNTFNNFARDTEAKLGEIRFNAESRRIDQLAELRMTYDKRIADMLSESVRTTSTLVSQQLLQIQATADTRLSKLEEFRWSSAGRSSVSDPALANALEQLGANISALKTTNDTRGGRGTGRTDMFGWIVAGAMVFAAVAGIGLSSHWSQTTPAIGIDSKRVDDLTNRLNDMSNRLPPAK